MQIKFYKGAPCLRARCFFHAEKEDGGIMTAKPTVRQRKNVVGKSAADGGGQQAGVGGRQAADTQPIIFLQSPPFGAGE